MSEAMQNLSDRQQSMMISLGHQAPPGFNKNIAKEQNEPEAKVKKKPKERQTISMREPDIKWREIRRWIRKYFLDIGYESSNYKKLYEQAEKEGVDLHCWPGKKVSLRSFASQALRVRLDLELPSIRRSGVKEKILDKFDAGFSEKDIQKLLDCSYSHVYNTLVNAGKIKKRPKTIY